jgi:arylsulfatase A
MKLWTTEAGFRVPGIMRWPAGIDGSGVVDQPVSTLDFLPTFCQLANIHPPAGLVLDGTSFLPALTNERILRSKPLIWIYYAAINERRVAMRDGPRKVLARLDLGKVKRVDRDNEQQIKSARLSDIQMFDLTQDIAEKRDLAASHPEALAESIQRLEIHYRELVNASHVWDADPSE